MATKLYGFADFPLRFNSLSSCEDISGGGIGVGGEEEKLRADNRIAGWRHFLLFCFSLHFRLHGGGKTSEKESF